MDRQTTRATINQILRIIGENGLCGVAASGASIPAALASIDSFPSSTSPARRYQLVNELKRQELVDVTKDKKNYLFQLTVKGIHRLQQAEIEALPIPVPANWDGKWRLVMFDIPAHRSESRYVLTSNLRRLRFKMIQKSFWVYPYPCFDIVEKIITHANLQGYVSLAEISRIDASTERQLKRHFQNLI